MNWKSLVENHPLFFVLSLILSAFLAGLAAYQGALEITGREIVGRVELKALQKEVGPIKVQKTFYRAMLAYYMLKDADDVDRATREHYKQQLVTLISDAYNASRSIDPAEQERSIILVMKGDDILAPFAHAKVKGDPMEWRIPKEIKEMVHLTNPR